MKIKKVFKDMIYMRMKDKLQEFFEVHFLYKKSKLGKE